MSYLQKWREGDAILYCANQRGLVFWAFAKIGQHPS